MATHTEQFTALILDDNPADAVLLKQMLGNLGWAKVKASIHHSSQGVFPSSPARFSWVFMADDYASSDPAQMVKLVLAQYRDAEVILTSDNSLSAQELLAAARSGLAQIIEKDSLSRSVLNETLQQISSNQIADEQQLKRQAPLYIDEHPQRKPLNPELEPVDRAASASTRSTLEQGSDWNELTTGIIVLEFNGTDWIFCSINLAAAEQENLDPATLLGTSLATAPFEYQNLKLAEQLADIQKNEQVRFTDVLQVDAEGEASWRNITATRNDQQRLILELHESTLHSAAEETTNLEQQAIWRQIVSSYPDLSALVDEDGSIIELVSGEWHNIKSDTDALKGQTLSSLIYEDQRQLCRELLSKALNTGKPQQTVFRLELSDGPMWLHSTLSLLRTPAATQRTALLVASNVTEMFERQQAGYAELETMKEFTRRMPFALAIKDSDGRFERANPYFLDLFGLRSDDVIGKAESDLFPEHLSAQLLELEQRMRSSNDVVEASVQVDPDDWMVYRFIKLPLHNELDNNLASCLLVLPSDGEDQIGASTATAERTTTKRAISTTNKKKSPRLKTNKP